MIGRPKAAFAAARRRFHAALLNSILTVDAKGVPANADKHSKSSVAIASGILERLGAPERSKREAGQTSGAQFEEVCAQFLNETFPKVSHLRPGTWSIGTPAAVFGGSGRETIAAFDQYRHLQQIAAIAADKPELAATLGGDYLIKPDVVVARLPEPDDKINSRERLVDGSSATLTPLRKTNNELPLLHAVISCKWTLRSDRAQNARSEGLNLVKNRKGHLPHIAVVTGEPTPARIASIALGTGEIDCVYHFALPELIASIEAAGADDARLSVGMMIEGHRLRDISDLPLDLAI